MLFFLLRFGFLRQFEFRLVLRFRRFGYVGKRIVNSRSDFGKIFFGKFVSLLRFNVALGWLLMATFNEYCFFENFAIKRFLGQRGESDGLIALVVVVIIELNRIDNRVKLCNL